MVDDVPDQDAVAAYVQDSARSGASAWTVATVIMHWMALGLQEHVVTGALKTSRASMPHLTDLLDGYETTVRTLINVR